ncbi:hypothetical protein A5634_12340 [Mycobacterium asiaticum]|uniref:Acyl-CoA carboxylase subunit epsilon n=1 Tax=Mycobacterium asiaticum TaxID=1790 RepID=A0A1A3NGQ0_MYCAS|nr:hypothetical protein A5634_12340 [Mycobacterium asiaticum]
MSDVTDVSEVTEPQPHQGHIQILKGRPTDQELAALIAVLGCIGHTAPPAPPEPTRWGLPVDKLRYPVFSWQRITLQEMTHMRR